MHERAVPATPGLEIRRISVDTEHEEVRWCRDESAEYLAVFAIHSTRRGPAIGGTRLRRYDRPDDALADALRLSRAMSMKTALAGLAAGGGKSVILEPATIASRERLLRAHGRAIETFGGRYVAGPDMGISLDDLEVMATETRYVTRHQVTGGAGGSDTARGTLRAIEGAADCRWGSADLRGRRIAVQGCGNVGAHLARDLAGAGAVVSVCDTDGLRAAELARSIGATVLDPAAFLTADVEILAPCAVGGLLSAGSVGAIRAQIIAGAANNQLADDAAAELLAARGILLVPDCVASAGGVIAGWGAFASSTEAAIHARIDAIRDTTIAVIHEARSTGRTPEAVAEATARRLTA